MTNKIKCLFGHHGRVVTAEEYTILSEHSTRHWFYRSWCVECNQVFHIGFICVCDACVINHIQEGWYITYPDEGMSVETFSFKLKHGKQVTIQALKKSESKEI